MTPTATIGSTTATGDVVTGPGCPHILMDCLPTACIGDMVDGAACVGAITEATNLNILFDMRPAGEMGSVVAGANPETGVPVATDVVVCEALNILD